MPDFDAAFDADEPDEFVMEVMEGGAANNVRRYTWDDASSLPREFAAAGDASGIENDAAKDFPFPGESPPGPEDGERGEGTPPPPPPPGDGEKQPEPEVSVPTREAEAFSIKFN